VLRVSVETRKTQLVDAALDCVQRLISHGILSGPVQSINHRREAASKAAGARKKQADGDDDDMDPAAQGPMPPQVPWCLDQLPNQKKKNNSALTPAAERIGMA